VIFFNGYAQTSKSFRFIRANGSSVTSGGGADNIVGDLTNITNTYNSKNSDEVNSLISLLGIQVAKINSKLEISPDTELILNTLTSLGSRITDLEKSINTPKHNISNYTTTDNITNLALLTSIEISELKVGDIIYHKRFGTGKITKIEGPANNPVATIPFVGGEKKLMLNYANLLKPYSKID
jgi:hypothetical protein